MDIIFLCVRVGVFMSLRGKRNHHIQYSLFLEAKPKYIKTTSFFEQHHFLSTLELLFTRIEPLKQLQKHTQKHHHYLTSVSLLQTTNKISKIIDNFFFFGLAQFGDHCITDLKILLAVV